MSHFGSLGHSGGGFHWLHMVAMDSKGDVYTGEVDTGKRAVPPGDFFRDEVRELLAHAK